MCIHAFNYVCKVVRLIQPWHLHQAVKSHKSTAFKRTKAPRMLLGTISINIYIKSRSLSYLHIWSLLFAIFCSSFPDRQPEVSFAQSAVPEKCISVYIFYSSSFYHSLYSLYGGVSFYLVSSISFALSLCIERWFIIANPNLAALRSGMRGTQTAWFHSRTLFVSKWDLSFFKKKTPQLFFLEGEGLRETVFSIVFCARTKFQFTISDFLFYCVCYWLWLQNAFDWWCIIQDLFFMG